MRPNWFFAFAVDGSFVPALPAPPPSFRLFHPEDVHLTLCFLGGCAEDAARRGLVALDAALERLPLSPLEVSLGEVVPMGPKRQYSALSALLERGRLETEACIAALRDAISEAAVGRREKRAPKAHVTLARPGRRVTDSGRDAGLVWAGSLNLKSVVTRLERIGLYTWSDGDRRERLFRVVEERSLG